MKKVLFVISYLYEGGAEKALAHITEHLPKEWDIDILLNGHQSIDFSYRGNLIYLGIDETPKMDSILFHLKILWKRIRCMYRLKRSGQYSACISFLDSANVANILTRTKRCRTIVSVRASLIEQGKMAQYKYIVNPLVRMLYNKADAVVAVSRGLGEELVHEFGIKRDKVVAIENGYALEELYACGKEEMCNAHQEFFEANRCIVTVGRLAEQKGQWHLLKAFSKFAVKYENVSLVIIGSGELKDYLESLTRELGIEEKVLFVGHSDNPYKYVSRAEMFVMSSLYEGFPNALAEAVCLEIPCIATDFKTGARELLAPDRIMEKTIVEGISFEKYGIITPCCSGEKKEELEWQENVLADAMEQLLKDDDLRRHYSKMCKERKQSLRIEHVVQEYEKIICNN